MPDETLLYRQVHPNFVINGYPNSQPFRPTKKDGNELSVDSNDLIGPDKAYRHCSQTRGLRSYGVAAITKAECEHAGLSVRPSPLPDNPAHTIVD